MIGRILYRIAFWATNWLRYGWPRRHLARLVVYLPTRLQNRLLDFLYLDDMGITFK